VLIYQRQLELAAIRPEHTSLGSVTLAQSNCDACDCVVETPIAEAKDVPIAPSGRSGPEVSKTRTSRSRNSRRPVHTRRSSLVTAWSTGSRPLVVLSQLRRP
jgi:hypothetical protein